MTAAYTPGAQIDFDQTFGELSADVLADLQDDLVILSDAYREYGASPRPSKPPAPASPEGAS